MEREMAGPRVAPSVKVPAVVGTQPSCSQDRIVKDEISPAWETSLWQPKEQERLRRKDYQQAAPGAFFLNLFFILSILSVAQKSGERRSVRGVQSYGEGEGSGVDHVCSGPVRQTRGGGGVCGGGGTGARKKKIVIKQQLDASLILLWMRAARCSTSFMLCWFHGGINTALSQQHPLQNTQPTPGGHTASAADDLISHPLTHHCPPANGLADQSVRVTLLKKKKKRKKCKKKYKEVLVNLWKYVNCCWRIQNQTAKI